MLLQIPLPDSSDQFFAAFGWAMLLERGALQLT